MKKKILVGAGTISIVLLCFVLVASISIASAYDIDGEEFTNRKPITIDNTGNANDLTDYQLKITVNHEPEMQPGFDDLRFTDSGGNVLEYWVEDSIPSTSATVWVKVTSIPGDVKTTIWMYYGNPSVSSQSDGDATFDIFEDFDHDDGEWTEYDLNNKIELDYTTDHKLKFNNWIRTDPGYVYKSCSARNFVEEYEICITNKWGNANTIGPGFSDTCGTKSQWQNGVGTEFYAGFGNIRSYIMAFVDGNNVWGHSGERPPHPNSIDVTTNTIYYVRLEKFEDRIKLSIFSDPARTAHIAESPKEVTADNLADTTFGYYYLVTGYTAFPPDNPEWTSGWMDNFRVREYAEPEPTVEVVSDEAVPQIVSVEILDVNDIPTNIFTPGDTVKVKATISNPSQNRDYSVSVSMNIDEDTDGSNGAIYDSHLTGEDWDTNIDIGEQDSSTWSWVVPYQTEAVKTYYVAVGIHDQSNYDNICYHCPGYKEGWEFEALLLPDLTFTQHAPPSSNVAIGTQNVLVNTLDFSATGDGIKVDAIKITLYGSGSKTDLSDVKIYKETGGYGFYPAADTDISNSETADAWDDGVCTVTLGTGGSNGPQTIEEGDATWYIVFDIASTATEGHTVGGRIASGADISAKVDGETIVAQKEGADPTELRTIVHITQTTPNLLKNPGFESGELNPWYSTKYSDPYEKCEWIDISVDMKARFEGEYCAFIDIQCSRDAWGRIIQEPIEITPGEKLDVEAKFMYEEDLNDGYAELCLVFLDEDQEYVEYVHRDYYKPDFGDEDKWISAVLPTTTVPSNAKYVRVMVGLANVKSCKLNADNVILKYASAIENHPPTAIRVEPVFKEVGRGIGDSIIFKVKAEDPDEDVHNNLYRIKWFVNDELKETDPADGTSEEANFIYTFENAGTFYVKATVYDEQMEEAFISWEVSVTAILVCRPAVGCFMRDTWTIDGIEMGILSRIIHPPAGEEAFYQFFIGHSWDFYETQETQELSPWLLLFEKGTIVVAVPEHVKVNYDGICFATAAGGPTGPRGWYDYEQPKEGDECAEAAVKGIVGQLPIGFIGNIFGFAFTVDEIIETCNSEYEYAWLEEEIKMIDKNEYDIIVMPWRAEDSYAVSKRSGVNLVLPLTFEKEGTVKYYYQFWHDGKRVTSMGYKKIVPIAKGT